MGFAYRNTIWELHFAGTSGVLQGLYPEFRKARIMERYHVPNSRTGTSFPLDTLDVRLLVSKNFLRV